MLLKLAIALCLTMNLMAIDGFKILKIGEEYYLTHKSDKKVSISYSGVPRLVSVKQAKGLDIIEYYSGSYGTSDVVEIHNRIVLYNGRKIIDAPFKYLNKKEQTVWNINHKNKIIEVTDPYGLNQKVKF